MGDMLAAQLSTHNDCGASSGSHMHGGRAGIVAVYTMYVLATVCKTHGAPDGGWLMVLQFMIM